MQIPIVEGIYADTTPDFRSAYPLNFYPVPKQEGISNGYLRPADGITQTGTGPGTCRGGINWNGTCYRVMGSKLVTVADSGTVTTLGDVGDDGNPAFLDYSFDRLAIWSNLDLFYWNGTTLTQVTDPDLGAVIGGMWIDGYFMSTDGTSIIVTDLADPTAVNPLKYGSSEVDPDPIVCLLKLRDEAVAVNSNTIEFFNNIGGTLFPFLRVDGALIEKGAVGRKAACIYLETVAFVGNGRNESPSVYMAQNGLSRNISTREVDTLLAELTTAQLATVRVEARNYKAHQHLLVHLPDRTLVYDSAASELLRQPVWSQLTSTDTVDTYAAYRARDLVWCYSKWLVADTASAKVGYLDDTVSTHWGSAVRWEFVTPILYNQGTGVLFHDLELVALTGSYTLGAAPDISSSYTLNGVDWSSERVISAGSSAQRDKRLVWFSQGYMRDWRAQRFRGHSDAHLAFARLEARLEPLAY